MSKNKIASAPPPPPQNPYSDPVITTAYAVPGNDEMQHLITETTHTSYDEDDCVAASFSALLNVVWIILGGGIPISILYFVAGLLFCMTIVGIPCGLQLFKLSFLALFPFGNSIERYEAENLEGGGGDAVGCGCRFLGNLLFLPISLVLLIVHLLGGIICACTIVGIPFAYAHLKMAQLALCPFGKNASYRRGHSTTTTTTTTTMLSSRGGGGGYDAIV
ncbi:hypothetical protein TrLO_g15375 [Triparma laevis f. longispina]|uniref:Inner membrane component domain-containing protein n=1 Tax=Triparma laevis f. longispina TaxID=1714387 RepID=A0A9W7F854_9STRA|nr:hypothetical protein TrLO_g15375 [Triparma laevis f. longispina]